MTQLPVVITIWFPAIFRVQRENTFWSPVFPTGAARSNFVFIQFDQGCTLIMLFPRDRNLLFAQQPD